MDVMASQLSRRIYIPFLDGLRGLAALYVCCHHFIGFLQLSGCNGVIRRLPLLFHFGHSAVSLFIILSGFSLMLPVVQNQGKLRGGWQSFIRRRARRILIPFYPALLISAIVAIVTNRVVANDVPSSLVANGLLLQNVLPRLPHINIAFWSVATEWQIYFLLPFLFLPLWSLRAHGKLTTLAAGALVGSVCFVFNSYGLAVACFWYAGLFTQGMLSADFAHRMITTGRIPKDLSYKLLGISAAAIALYTATWKLVDAGNSNAGVGPQHWHYFYASVALRDTFLGVLSCCLILYLTARKVSAQSTRKASVAVRFLESPPLKTLGRFSYSLYLTHGIVLMCLDYAMGHSHPQPMVSLATHALGVMVSVCFAYGFYLVFERPVVTQRVATRQFA